MQNNYYVRNKKDIRVQPNKTIYLPYDNFINNYGSSNSISIRVYFYDKNKNYIGNFKTFTNFEKNRWKTNTPSNCYYIRFYCSGIGTTYNNDIIISYFDTSYTPHKEQVLPLTLGNIELCKIGDYQDYFYKESNKWYLHKEIEKVVFDGSEGWTNFATESTGLSRAMGNGNNIYYDNVKATVKCNKLIGTPYSGSWNKTDECIAAISNNRFIIYLKNVTNLQEFISKLSTLNLIIYYVLATPTDIEITDTTLISQLEAINNAISYEEQTNIRGSSNGSNPIFSVEGYQSTKLVLEEMATAIVALGGV